MMKKIGVIGLGYVGLPLAVTLAGKYAVTGFDINKARVAGLQKGHDHTQEVSDQELQGATNLTLTSNPELLSGVEVFIVTVPTPIDAFKTPDLTPLRKASELVGRYLQAGGLVIYESTVYPGCTEEVCVPLLEQHSGLTYNQGFACGYSPERINPGDKQHRLTNIKKVVSGSNPSAAKQVQALYDSIIEAGTYLTTSIKVAEAAKVIENAQRDINIAFVNELALIFDKVGIDTHEVLEAAGTKWNFLPFKPGLVGGHCIGVDPYYLTHKAESLNYHPEVILAGRRINDNMGVFVAGKMIKLMAAKGISLNGARVLVLGVTFKENCPDIRNSRVVDVISELKEFGLTVEVHDPQADAEEVQQEYGIALTPTLEGAYDGIVLAVAHAQFLDLPWGSLKHAQTAVYDIKGFLPRQLVDARL